MGLPLNYSTCTTRFERDALEFVNRNKAAQENADRQQAIADFAEEVIATAAVKEARVTFASDSQITQVKPFGKDSVIDKKAFAEKQAATKVAPAKSSSKLKYFILATAIPAAYAAYVYYMNTLAGQNSNQPK